MNSNSKKLTKPQFKKVLGYTSLLMTLFFSSMITSASHAAIVSSQNTDLNCTEYRSINNSQDSKIDLIQQAIDQGAILVSERPTYGFALENIHIDFDKNEVTLNLIHRVMMAFDYVLFSNIKLSANNPNLDKYVNQLNHDYYVATKVCIDSNKELISFE